MWKGEEGKRIMRMEWAIRGSEGGCVVRWARDEGRVEWREWTAVRNEGGERVMRRK